MKSEIGWMIGEKYALTEKLERDEQHKKEQTDREIGWMIGEKYALTKKKFTRRIKNGQKDDWKY